MVNSQTSEIASVTQMHAKKISDVYLKDGIAVITTSYDGTLKVTSLCSEIDD